MINGKKVLGIIPARAGSKGLPGKNIKELNGLPVIAWTIRSALNSDYIDDVIVSSDGEEILEISRTYGAQTPFVRPDELSSDTATSVDVVEHALDFMKNELSKEYEYFILLEPTSPIREDDDIDKMFKRLDDKSNQCDSIVSIGEVAHHPYIMKTLEGDSLEPLIKTDLAEDRRQNLPDVYFPFGVGYAVKVDVFKEERSFYTKRNTYHLIKKHQCFEIDDICDFYAIEGLLKNIEGIK